jgi:hypothetical protein
VRDTFYRDAERSRDPAQYALGYLLAELIEFVKGATDIRDPSAWRSDPFAYRVIELAFAKILAAERPPGEICALNIDSPRGYAGLFVMGDELSPEVMADHAAGAVLMWKERPQMSETIVEGQLFTAEQERQHYRMTNARDDLRLKKGEQS